MTGRRRQRSRLGLLLLVFGVAAVAAALVWLRNRGVEPPPAATIGGAPTPIASPREKITEDERERLRRILEQKSEPNR